MGNKHSKHQPAPAAAPIPASPLDGATPPPQQPKDDPSRMLRTACRSMAVDDNAMNPFGYHTTDEAKAIIAFMTLAARENSQSDPLALLTVALARAMPLCGRCHGDRSVDRNVILPQELLTNIVTDEDHMAYNGAAPSVISACQAFLCAQCLQIVHVLRQKKASGVVGGPSVLPDTSGARNLRLDANQLSPAQLAQMNVAAAAPNLRSLELLHCDLGAETEDETNPLLTVLGESRAVRRLRIVSPTVFSGACLDAAKWTASAPNLTRLDLVQCGRDAVLHILVARVDRGNGVIALAPTLKIVNVSSNELIDEDMAPLLDAFVANLQWLSALVLSRNKFKAPAAKALKDRLASLPLVEVLDVSCNQMGATMHQELQQARQWKRFDAF